METPSGIAIIGMACRLPGADTPAELWQNLCRGVESIRFFTDQELLSTGITAQLLSHPRYVKAAPTLNDPYRFDAAFFEYSPREAALMDPQQRLFLEVAWETFEAAGYDPQANTDPVGVFAGGGGVVTSYLLAHLGDPQLPGATGGLEHIANDKDFLATRVSYELNLTGPSITVQTACSTSLVAVHLACQSLLNRECAMALAGAATVRVPHLSGYLSEKGSIHSSDGHCRSFDAAGTGTIFGSGVVAVLLRPVEDAIAAGDHIHAIIRGTAVNNDGGRKVSYTAPSVVGQARAMVEALAVADVPADTIDYVECHATGTTVGDPLEIQALSRAFRTQTDREGFCAVGSIKANIGHPEQAAGLAGLIKTALALEHGVIPLNRVATLNPDIPFSGSPFYVNTELRPFPQEQGRPRRAAVNSLGIGGTNAFAVLEQAEEYQQRPDPERRHHLLCLSARSPQALRSRAAQFAEHVRTSSIDLGDLCHTANISRSRLNHKLALVVDDIATVHSELQAIADGEDSQAAIRVRPSPGAVAFLFSGQGAQYPGMGMELFRSQLAFREALEECDALARPQLDRGIIDLIRAKSDTTLDQTGHTQPALFALGYALARMWQSWGIQPSAVMGHSLGEITAACIASVVSLPEAMRLVIRRAALMQALPTDGAMLAVLGDCALVKEILDEAALEGVSIAAHNGPRNVVVSGPRERLKAALAVFSARNIPTRALNVSHAFHSTLMEPMLNELEAAAGEIDAQAPQIPLISNLTGQLLTTAPKPHYWRDHARQTVQFADSIATLSDLGATVFIEIGPGDTLLTMARGCLDAPPSTRRGNKRHWLPSLDRQRSDWATTLGSLREAYLEGFDIDWTAVDAGHPYRRISLPTYPFQRRHFSLEAPPLNSPHRESAPRATDDSIRPSEVRIAVDRVVLSGLSDHRIGGHIVLPTAVIALEALRAARGSLGERACLTDMTYPRAVVLPEVGSVPVELSMTTSDNNVRFRLLVDHGADGGGWQEHARGVIRAAIVLDAMPADLAVRDVQARCVHGIDRDDLYAELHRRGFGYGPSFRSVERVWYGDHEALSRVVRTPGSSESSLIDACLHAYPLLLEEWRGGTSPGPQGIALPVELARLQHHYDAELKTAWVHTTRRRTTTAAGHDTIDVIVYDDDGSPVFSFTAIRTVLVPPANLRREAEYHLLRGLFHLAWRERERSTTLPRSTPEQGPWLLLVDDSGFGQALAATLEANGGRCLLFRHGRGTPSDRLVDPFVAADRQAWVARLERLSAAEPLPFRGVVHCWALDTPRLEETNFDQVVDGERVAAGSALAVTQALGSLPQLRSARLWLVTRNAVAAGNAVEPVAALQASLWGLGRTIALERPQQWGGLIDLPPAGAASPTEEVAQVLAQLESGDGEDQVALRGDRRYVARLAPLRPGPVVGRSAPLRTDGTYLITGGLGMLGLKIATWLVEQRGIRSLVLTGRSGAGEETRPALESLQRTGATVCVLAADMADESAVARVFAHIDATLPPLRGVFHGAGILSDGIIEDQDWASFSRGTAPKIRAAWLLHEHTRGRDLDLFVLHSSLLSWTGAIGQSNYTAGNAFLDALVDHRRTHGLPAQAINWGPWAETGMAAASGERGQMLWRRLGVSFIPPELGMQVLDLVQDRGWAHTGLTLTDWTRYRDARPMSGQLLSELLQEGEKAARSGSAGITPIDGLKQGQQLDAGQRDSLVAALAREVMNELGFDQPIDVEQPLNELGLDSLMSVNLANRIEASVGIGIPLARLIRGPSVSELADLLLDTAGAETLTRSAGNRRSAGSVSSERVSTGRWLVFPRPRPQATMRLFCFPYAGGGAAIYRPWAEQMDSSIELVAVEPPGHGSRIEEPPVRRIGDYLAGVISDLRDYQDKPYAFFGHCLGGLNVYAVARQLLRTDGSNLSHLFLSGSRAPSRLNAFQEFEDKLVSHLLKLDRYDPACSLDEQPDEVFTASLGHFNIGATDEWLANDELRAVLLPGVRADFEMARRFEVPDEPPWDVPITCFAGLGDPYASRQDVMHWAEHTRSSFQIHFLDSAHFLIVDDREFLIARINEALVAMVHAGRTGGRQS